MLHLLEVLLDSLHHVGHSLLVVLLTLKQFNIGVEFLVKLLSVCELCSQVRHLVHLLLVYFDHCLVLFQIGRLLLGLIELVLKTLHIELVLAFDQGDLLLKHNSALVFLVHLI